MNSTNIPLTILISKIYDVQNMFIIIPDNNDVMIVCMINSNPILMGCFMIIIIILMDIIVDKIIDITMGSL